jgi:hypothetical protein
MVSKMKVEVNAMKGIKRLPSPKNALPVIVSAALALLLLAGAGVFLFVGPAKGTQEELAIMVPSGNTWKFAVLSDALLSAEESAEARLYQSHTESAFLLLKELNVPLVLTAGNMAGSAQKKDCARLPQAYDAVFAGSKNAPALLSAMGAGELKNALSAALAQRSFAAALGQRPCAHYVIRGLHFLTLSADRKDARAPYSAAALAWLARELALANEASQGLPIFVVTAFPPGNTSLYGAEQYGVPALNAILAPYKNVISISGGTHRPQLDERSIAHNGYALVGSQGLSYVSLEPGYFDPLRGGGTDNAAQPPQASAQPFLLIFEIGGSSISIQRWNVLDRVQEKTQAVWRLKLPLGEEPARYDLAARTAKNGIPYFPGSGIAYTAEIQDSQGRALDGVTFRAAQDDMDVTAYEIEAVNWLNVISTKRYVSDYFLGAGGRTDNVTLALDPRLPSGEYTVRVFALDAFGRRSTSYQSIKLTHRGLKK